MTDLATQIEQAGPEQQREMLKLAWIRIHHGDGAADTPHNTEFLDDPECRRCDAFWSLLNIGTDEAFTGAALMLVPEGLVRRIEDHVCLTMCEAVLIDTSKKLGDYPNENAWSGRAATPALALCAASLKARNQT